MLAAAFLRTVGAAGPLAFGVVDSGPVVGDVDEGFILVYWNSTGYTAVS